MLLGKKKNEISFGSKIKVEHKKTKFLKFSKGWISKNDVSPISFKESNPFKNISIFKNVKYKWGGKSFKGLDCSALIQIFLNLIINFVQEMPRIKLNISKKMLN